MQKKKNKMKTGQKPINKGRIRKKIKIAFNKFNLRLLRKYPNHSGYIIQESFNAFLSTVFMFISMSNIKTEDLIQFLQNQIKKMQHIIDAAEDVMSKYRAKKRS